MDVLYWLNPILNFLVLLSVVAGLWIASRLLPAAIAWIQSETHQDLLSRPVAKIILWFASGTLFTLPLIDFVSWIGNAVTIAFVPIGQGGFLSLTGPISSQFTSLFYLLLMTAVYGIILWVARGYIVTPGRFTQPERIFIVLSIAQLAHRGILNILIPVFSFDISILNVQQNSGIAGFLLSLFIGVILLVVVFVSLNQFLPNHPVGDAHH